MRGTEHFRCPGGTKELCTLGRSPRLLGILASLGLDAARFKWNGQIAHENHLSEMITPAVIPGTFSRARELTGPRALLLGIPVQRHFILFPFPPMTEGIISWCQIY